MLVGYTFILPWVIGLVSLFVIPIVESFLYSFQSVSVLAGGGLERPWAGLTHYQRALLEDPDFMPKLLQAFRNMLTEVPIILVFSIFVAMLLNQKFHGRAVVRCIFFLPLMLSSTVLLGIIQGETNVSSLDTGSVYMVSSASIEDIVLKMGVSPEIVSFLTGIIDRIFNLTWQSGVQILLFLTGLQTIPSSLKEAASVEGATSWEYFCKIILPMISPVILVNVIYTIIDTFTSYTNPAMKYISDQANGLNYSYSSALAWLYFVCIMVILGVVMMLLSRKIFYSDSE
jgi:ABC-type sugar transport system permease subunit